MFDALVNGRIDCGELTFEVAYYDIEERFSSSMKTSKN